MKIHANLVFLYVLIAIVGGVLADNDARPATSEPMLPGSAEEKEPLLGTVTDVAIAKLESPGEITVDTFGITGHEAADVKVIRSLKGTLAGKVKASYEVASAKQYKEDMPVLGVNYIMFIENPGPLDIRIRKMIPATDANISAVKALIASKAGKGKEK